MNAFTLFLFLVKMVANSALLVCKTFGPKIQSCKFFDKSQVCISHSNYNLTFLDLFSKGTLIFCSFFFQKIQFLTVAVKDKDV